MAAALVVRAGAGQQGPPGSGLAVCCTAPAAPACNTHAAGNWRHAEEAVERSWQVLTQGTARQHTCSTVACNQCKSMQSRASHLPVVLMHCQPAGAGEDSPAVGASGAHPHLLQEPVGRGPRVVVEHSHLQSRAIIAALTRGWHSALTWRLCAPCITRTRHAPAALEQIYAGHTPCASPPVPIHPVAP